MLWNQPLIPLELMPLPLKSSMSYKGEEKAKEMKKVHQEIWTKIEKTNEMYKARANKHRKAITFKPEDLVWLHLTKGRFPSRRQNKLMPRRDGPFKDLKWTITPWHELVLSSRGKPLLSQV